MTTSNPPNTTMRLIFMLSLLPTVTCTGLLGRLFPRLGIFSVRNEECSTTQTCGSRGWGRMMFRGEPGTDNCEEQCFTFPGFRTTNGFSCGTCATGTTGVIDACTSSGLEGLPRNQLIVEEEKQFDMCLMLNIDPLDVDAFIEARDRWSRVIRSDIPPFDARRLIGLPCGDFPNEIDDLYICGQQKFIDRKGGVLGYASATYVRRDKDKLPAVGSMVFDAYDMETMREDGRFVHVVAHEMGHILGLGSRWGINGVTGDVEDGCPYLGPNANREFQEISGCTNAAAPTEQNGGSGTRCSHWDESCMKNELMTGWSGAGFSPMSTITIGSLEDMGYAVDYSGADNYTADDMLSSCVCNGGGTRTRQLANELEEPRRRRLSAEGEANAWEFGQQILWENSVVADAEGQRETDEVQYVGDRQVVVMYEEDGIMYHVIVTS